MDRQKTNVFLLSLDEDLLVYEEELKKRGFTSSATLKYIRENNLEEMNMAEGHKRLLMNAVSQLQSPQAKQITTKEYNNMVSKSNKKRRISYATRNINKPSSPSFEQPFIDSDKEERQSNSSCGNCHLRLGHRRRNCTFSPCKSVYSCGLLEKHPDEKKKYECTSE